ncbi:MAG: DegV family protein, partial [Syntrophomonadaceae bacterium]
MKVKLMADSTCDLSRDVIESYDIAIAPLVITIDGREYSDRIDIDNDEFYHNLPTYELFPTTSQPTPESYLACLRAAEEQGYDRVLCICMSSGTSGSYNGAVLAKEMYLATYPDTKIRIAVIDSVGMSHGSGWLIMKCARLREAGYTFEELIDYCETIKYRVKHFLSVEDLENLIRSGRISNMSGWVGKLLHVRPIMTMKNTRGAIVAKKRGQKEVLRHYVQEFQRRVDHEQTDFIIIGYTSDISRAEALQQLLTEETGFRGQIYLMQMGVAVG